MPERKNKLLKRVDSEEVQGEGSYVILKAPTLDSFNGRTLPEDNSPDAAFEFGVAVLPGLVAEWNWVDDDGDPLPQPKDVPEVVRSLPIQELTFLIGATGLGNLADQKN